MSAAMKIPSTETPPPLQKVFKTSTIQRYKAAPMGKRIIAFIVDSLIVSVGAQLIGTFVAKALTNDTITGIVVSFLSVLILTCAYWVYLPLHYKGTPGKKMMGLRIVTEKHSRQLSMGMMFKRELFGRFLSGIVLGIGYLSAFGDKQERRTWHDRLAKTRVIVYR